MKAGLIFLNCLFLIVSFAGCAPQDKKNAEDTTAAPVRLPNFDRPVPPVMMTDNQERAGYLIMHYWDNFNFRDTMYCHAPEITEQALADFINLFPQVDSEVVSRGVKKLLDAAEEDVVMYNYFYQKAEHYLYNPNSPVRNDEFFIPFLEHLISSPKVIEVSKERPRYQLNLAYRNRIGTKASDITYTLNSGATGNLYSISSKYVLLMFVNPDCLECQRATGALKASPAVTMAVSRGLLEVLAVYPDENLEIWKQHLGNYPATWISGYDKDLSIRNKELYDLKAIPTLYLLDKDKKVIFKDTSIDNIHYYIERDIAN